jgi:dTDP-4-dehydrorhamnose 3,5-epimerase
VIFTPLSLDGAYVVEGEPRQDERGSYTPTWCAREFGARGLGERVVQTGLSFNRRRGTLRGMHYQVAPHSQAKLVHCIRGAIHDVIIDLRRESPTWCQWTAVPLSASSGAMLYIPEGFAHGFQTLADETEVLYLMSEYYDPGAERGIRWNDPSFAIAWPLSDLTISVKDRSYPDFRP